MKNNGLKKRKKYCVPAWPIIRVYAYLPIEGNFNIKFRQNSDNYEEEEKMPCNISKQHFSWLRLSLNGNLLNIFSHFLCRPYVCYISAWVNGFFGELNKRLEFLIKNLSVKLLFKYNSNMNIPLILNMVIYSNFIKMSNLKSRLA